MRGSTTELILVAACALLLPGCAVKATPRQKPLETTKVDTGAGSLQATRQALEGTWTLVSLDVIESGVPRRLPAKGTLTYDAFGNMTIEGRIENDAARTPTLLEYTGRIVIDTTRKQFYPADLVAGRPVDGATLAPVSPDKARRYELTSDTLTVTYMDAASNPTAIANWRRVAS